MQSELLELAEQRDLASGPLPHPSPCVQNLCLTCGRGQLKSSRSEARAIVRLGQRSKGHAAAACVVVLSVLRLAAGVAGALHSLVAVSDGARTAPDISVLQPQVA